MVCLCSNIHKVTLSTKMTITIQIARAILLLHTAKPPLTHLDIKPANILVSSLQYVHIICCTKYSLIRKVNKCLHTFGL